jgi:hypothetical protein
MALETPAITMLMEMESETRRIIAGFFPIVMEPTPIEMEW